MGCGQSKIHLYPRKSKSKANGKKGGHDAEPDEDESYFDGPDKSQNKEPAEKNDESEDRNNKCSTESDDEVSVSLLRAKNLSLLQSQEISTSQQNFFRMLDKKIEEGPDYDSASETEIALEEARLNALVQHWESASLTASICSSASRSLQSTPIRQASFSQILTPRSTLKSVFGMPPKVIEAEFLEHACSPQSFDINSSPLHYGPSHVQMNMMPETSGVNAKTSNVVTIMQTNPSVNQPQQHITQLLTIPAGHNQFINMANVSPKHLSDGRLVIGARPLTTKQVQQSMGSQFIATSVISSNTTSCNANSGRAQQILPLQLSCFGQPPTQNIPSNMQSEIALDGQSPSNFTEMIPNVQNSTEYRFPPAISVQRLAPQVQRQIRETQELIKDSCPQLYAAGYGSPGPPIRNQNRNPSRRSTLETQISQELS